MRLGLLLCDHVRERHLGIAGDYPDHFRRLFAGHPEVDLVFYDAIDGELPSSPFECDAWMTTGSRHSANDPIDWIRDLEDFIRQVANAGVPFVGICFGHQLLARALGGRVVKSEDGWVVGARDVSTTEGSFRIMNMHQDQVVDLPEGARILGWSEHCPVSVMGIGDTMLGIQGHPEMPGAYTETLLRERRGELIPAETADEGLASLSEPIDEGLLADWMVRFISAAAGIAG